jgi:hypothetical protein
MNKKVIIIIGVLVVLLGGAGGYVYTQRENNDEKKVEKTSIAPNNPSSDTTSASLVVKEDPAATDDLTAIDQAADDAKSNDTDAKIDTTKTPASKLDEVSDTPTETSETTEKSVTYKVPKGRQSTINVKLATKNGVVENVSFDYPISDPESDEYHSVFDSNFPKNSVIGLKVSEIEDVFVAGASLTSKAFNEAITQL